MARGLSEWRQSILVLAPRRRRISGRAGRVTTARECECPGDAVNNYIAEAARAVERDEPARPARPRSEWARARGGAEEDRGEDDAEVGW